MKKLKFPEFDPVKAAARGYTREDWDAVDSPELTKEELAAFRPFAEVFPEASALIKRKAGRPKLDSPKEAITLRLDQTVIDRFKATGPDWRARMAEVLEKTKL